jgi:hypothetical protein
MYLRRNPVRHPTSLGLVADVEKLQTVSELTVTSKAVIFGSRLLNLTRRLWPLSQVRALRRDSVE